MTTVPPQQTAGPDLLYSDVEDELRASVRALLTDRCPPSAVLARCESAAPYDDKLWRTLAGELGLAGLLVPEELGGQGASAREVAVVMEELGAAVAPVPFLGSAVLATTALLAVSGGRAELAGLASGERTGALVVPLSAGPGGAFPDAVTARADATGDAGAQARTGLLTGRVTTVPDAAAADLLLVPAVDEEGPALYAVPVGAPGVGLASPPSLDLTRPIADVAFEQARGVRVSGPGEAEPALARALTAAAGLLASEQLGVGQWCLDTTVAYLKERTQFARPVGSFQALKHRVADLWLELVSARATARAAADALACLAAGTLAASEAAVSVSLAQAYCSTVAVHAAEECVQLHGGIGMTWEHPAHLYLKRAKADEIALGTPGHHRAALAGLVGIPAVTPA